MKPILPRAGFLLVLLAGFLFCGCAHQQTERVFVKDGKRYGLVSSGTFRNRWWNYYERGLSYSEGEFYRNAAADFKEAIRQREEDQRRARTYGMHFIDYFPHRELGIVYFQQGDLEAAEAELNISLSQFPSAKAQFYLDRVRRQLIERNMGEVRPPKLMLDLKSETVWTREDPVILSGSAEDEHSIKTVKANGVPVFLERPQRRVAFQEKLHLAQGRHRIEVEAYNIVGGRTARQITIWVDREGPLISIDRLAVEPAGAGCTVQVAGSLHDHAGVAELRLNGRPLKIGAGTEIPFSHQLTTDSEELEVAAADRLGNTTTARIPIIAAQSGVDTGVWYAGWSPSPANHLQPVVFGSQTARPTEIVLRGWTENQTVYLEKAYLEGRVRDDRSVVGLEINASPVLKQKGKLILFSHLVELAEGRNHICIRAVNGRGRVTEKTIIITRRVPKALQLAERMSLAVLPFDQQGDWTAASDAFQDFLIAALVDRDRFEVLERDKLDLVLREQKLSRTRLFDEKTAIRVGKLIAAKFLVAGSIVQTRLGSEIIVRIVDTETSDILSAVDVYDEVTDIVSLKSLAEGAALKLHREFPLLDGLVIDKKGGSIFSDLGEGKIKIGRCLIVFREEPVNHPVTGMFLGADNVILGRARVNQVTAELSKAEILGGESETIKPLDKVITE